MILIIISAVYFMITYKIDSVVSKSLCKNKAAFPLVVYYFFFFFAILGPHLCHMEVPRLGVKSELQLPATATATATWDLSCVCDLHHS